MQSTSNVLARKCAYKLNGFRFNRTNLVENCREDASLLLDVYGGAAGAWSFRQLKTGVTNVCRVRRGSDNAEQDFTASGVSGGALTTFTGASDGFVTTLYDQSGNGQNAVQATANNQPRVVVSGSLVVDASNGRPAMKWNGTGTDAFLRASGISEAQANHTFSVIDNSSFGVASNVRGAIHDGATRQLFDQNGTGYRILAGVWVDSGTRTNDHNLFSVLFDGASSVFRKNGSNVFSGSNVGTSSIIDMYLWGQNTGGAGLRSAGGEAQEIILYGSDKSADVTDIESNINSYYGVY
jgi:hypothetical protein